MSDPIIIARRLKEAGATIWVDVDAAGGLRQFRLDPSEAAQFLDDPRAWTAKQWGITAVHLDESEVSDCMPRCGATTKAGKRCANRLTSEVDPNAMSSSMAAIVPCIAEARHVQVP